MQFLRNQIYITSYPHQPAPHTSTNKQYYSKLCTLFPYQFSSCSVLQYFSDCSQVTSLVTLQDPLLHSHINNVKSIRRYYSWIHVTVI